MREEMIKGLSLSELKKEDFNKLKKWKEEEYIKIRSDLGLILEGQKLNQKDLRLVVKPNERVIDVTEIEIN